MATVQQECRPAGVRDARAMMPTRYA